MAQAVIFPKLGQTMEEGAIVKWLKREGDKVAKGDILFEIETDKANLEVESFFEGTLIKIYVGEGVTVPVNTVVGYIGAAGEQAPAQPPLESPAPAAAPPPSPAAPPAAPPVQAAPAAPALEASTLTATPAPPSPAIPSPAATAPAAPTRMLAISPRARALARASCIDPAAIAGSGPGGRIVEKDVRTYLTKVNYEALRIAPAAKRLAGARGIDILSVRGSGVGGRIMIEDIKRAINKQPVALTRMRQVIAQRLVESKQTIPHFYVTVKADLTDLMALRAELKERGVNYSVNDFILMSVALSLEEFPIVNSVTDGKTVSWRGDVDLGMAVSVENGLVVPVIRAVQTLTLGELAAQARALAEKARAGKLLPDEMSGSSFTVSNMGMLNIDQFSAIINPGEAGILAVSSGKPTPAVVNGEIKIRTLMAMTLSVDHRIVDGAVAAEFANAIRDKLESAALWQALV